MMRPPAPHLPPDVDPESRCRLPLPRREDLDEAGRQAYDRANRPGTLAGLQGPAGLQLHIPEAAPHLSALNTYLRFKAGFTAREREVAILATAREMDSRFEWAAHEPEALKEGVPEQVVDAIKHRRGTQGLPPEDALIIDLARQLWRDHRVDASTFARLRQAYGARKLMDLVVLMGTYANTAAMLAVADVQLPPGAAELPTAADTI
jgi:4-carboxymuconolactone decarboxylase